MHCPLLEIVHMRAFPRNGYAQTLFLMPNNPIYMIIAVGPLFPGVIQASGQNPPSVSFLLYTLRPQVTCTRSCLPQVFKYLQSQLTSGPLGLIVLVILPDRAEEIRREVKRWGEITAGVPTQCVVNSKLYFIY